MKPNPIDARFEKLRAENKKAFIPFITAGDPSAEATYLIAKSMIENGADLIEFGVPYSDPSADGPVIMRADERALAAGIRLVDVFEICRRTTQEYPEIPVLLLLYFNSIFVYGMDKFMSACKDSGISGLIIPDLPFEERDELEPTADQYGVYLISMVTPTSFDRIRLIVPNAKGFLYCVSTSGVTGERQTFETQFQEYMDALNTYSDIPKCLGFGISTPEQKQSLEKYCDGIIVGSALVKKIEDAVLDGLSESAIADKLGATVKAFTGDSIC
ncbi:MAG: tryptophan synthase subunit alpha [Clostridiaceae bacterium]|nr:tryptophan synthase subunit alpha [Clostridiaceae bacterium]